MNIHQLNELKQKCLKSKQRDAWIVLFGLLVIIAIAVWSVSCASSAGSVPTIAPILFVATFVIIIIAVAANHKNITTTQNTYNAAYKNYFADKTLSGFLQNYQYSHNRGIDSATIKDLDIIKFGNFYHTNDLITGDYKDVHFTQADITIKNPSSDNDNPTYFQGHWVIVDYPKKFNSKLIIAHKALSGIVKAPAGCEKLETESTEFSKHMNIYAADGREMFYILNPKVIERIEHLTARYILPAFFVFDQQKLHICISATDSLEPPAITKKPLDEAEELRRHSDQTRFVFDLVDALELSKKSAQNSGGRE